MPQTVLAGPDGKPAIDQATGMPLTMEEMLRRRGIVGMGTTNSMIGPASAAGPVPVAATNPATGTPTNNAVSAAAAALMSSGGVNPNDPNAVAAATGQAPTAPAIDPATGQPVVDPNAAANGGGGGVDVNSLLSLLGVGAAGIGGAYAYSKLRKGRVGTVNADGTVNAEYRDVPNNRLGRANVARRIASPNPRLTEVKKLPGPSTSEVTASAKAIAKRGNTMATRSEDAYAGLRRTVTKRIPKVVNEAPAAGLARTLARVSRGL